MTCATTSLAEALSSALRPCHIPGADDYVADPIAADILGHPAFPLLEASLAGRGVCRFKFAAAGISAAVLEISDTMVVRLTTHGLPSHPDLRALVQPLARGEFSGLAYEILPRAEPPLPGDDAVVEAALAAEGVIWTDQGLDNVGRLDDEPVLLDPGGLVAAATLRM